MSTLRPKSGHILAEAIARLSWASLAALHVLPLCRTSSAILHQGASFSRLAVFTTLILFLAFFILKALGVGFLRVRGRRASLVAFLLCCGLIHGEDVAQWAKDPARHDVAWAVCTTATVLGTAACAPRAVRALRRRMRETLDGLRYALGSALSALPRLYALAADVGWRAGPAPGSDPGVPRGPPLLA